MLIESILDPINWSLETWIVLWLLIAVPSFVLSTINLHLAISDHMVYRPFNGLGFKIIRNRLIIQVVLWTMNVSMIILAVVLFIYVDSPIRDLSVKLLLITVPIGLVVINRWTHKLERYVRESEDI